MSAKNLIRLLREQALIDDAALRDLQSQIAKKKISAATIAKALVEKGLLTKFQAAARAHSNTCSRRGKSGGS